MRTRRPPPCYTPDVRRGPEWLTVPASNAELTRLVAGILVTAAIIALLVVQFVVLGPPRVPPVEHPLEKGLVQRPWRRLVLVLAVTTASIAVGLILIVTVALGSGADTIVRATFLLLMIPLGTLIRRDNRRKGLKPARPWTNGPPGWEWDPDAATWREPR